MDWFYSCKPVCLESRSYFYEDFGNKHSWQSINQCWKLSHYFTLIYISELIGLIMIWRLRCRCDFMRNVRNLSVDFPPVYICDIWSSFSQCLRLAKMLELFSTDYSTLFIKTTYWAFTAYKTVLSSASLKATVHPKMTILS